MDLINIYSQFISYHIIKLIQFIVEIKDKFTPANVRISKTYILKICLQQIICSTKAY